MSVSVVYAILVTSLATFLSRFLGAVSSQRIKGKADAEATGIYANAYGRSPEFYNFIKSLETYKNTVDSTSSIILSTDNQYLKYLNK